MISPHQQKDRRQILIFAAVCVAMIVIGFAWAVFGDASDVTPVPTATATVLEATPSTPAP